MRVSLHGIESSQLVLVDGRWGDDHDTGFLSHRQGVLNNAFQVGLVGFNGDVLLEAWETGVVGAEPDSLVLLSMLLGLFYRLKLVGTTHHEPDISLLRRREAPREDFDGVKRVVSAIEESVVVASVLEEMDARQSTVHDIQSTAVR